MEPLKETARPRGSPELASHASWSRPTTSGTLDDGRARRRDADRSPAWLQAWYSVTKSVFPARAARYQPGVVLSSLSVQGDVMSEDLARPENHPSPEELIGYKDGRLGEAVREHVLRHLAVCSDCACVVRDLASFPDVEARDPRHDVSEEEVSRRWTKFRERLPG